jgi:hypothetical protein
VCTDLDTLGLAVASHGCGAMPAAPLLGPVILLEHFGSRRSQVVVRRGRERSRVDIVVLVGVL